MIMLVLQPTVCVRMLHKIDLAVTWIVNCIAVYAWPVVKWITSANMLFVTNNGETDEERILADERDEPDDYYETDDYDEHDEHDEPCDHDKHDLGEESDENVVTFDVPDIYISFDDYKCDDLTVSQSTKYEETPGEAEQSEEELLTLPRQSQIHESKSMPDLLITNPIMCSKDLKVRPHSWEFKDLKRLGASQHDLSLNKDDSHKFITRFSLSSSNCFVCSGKVKFGKLYKKCKICKTICHIQCGDHIKTKCIKNKSASKQFTLNYGKDLILDDFLSDGVKVPYLLKRCVDEIEARGLSQEGLYRISGSDKEIKELKRKFLENEPNLDLSELDINVVCGTLKDFLRSLKDPLIPNAMWKAVTEAAVKSVSDEFHAAVCCLPEKNLHSLKFVITHLQKVMSNPENKMSKDNLAKILGPTVVGYSSGDPSPLEMIGETVVLAKCMGRLLELECQ
eukprot:GFUD01023175.1.p1 GENE.GFUD01023175.1~~GFUD01023175.1.p1  ORF type:complete len:452 (+),score=112.89 GFUD01023175.1:66-1421(+)